MNSISASVTTTANAASESSQIRTLHLRCSVKNLHNLNGLCTRKVVWMIDGIGHMCNYCWTIYFADHWKEIDLDRVHRLSDDERDFHVRPELNRKYYRRSSDRKP